METSEMNFNNKKMFGWSRLASFAFLGVAAMTQIVPAHAGLIVNGDFENTPGHVSGFLLSPGNLTDLPPWTVNGAASQIACVLFPAAPTDCGPQDLWAASVSPDGGNFFVLDTDKPSQSDPVPSLSQMITGLTPGLFYTVSFYQAGVQFTPQSTGNGLGTNVNWQVWFGNSWVDAALIHTPEHGFSGWSQQNIQFQATSTSALLQFFALGNPAGAPPALALDDVDVSQVPEPTTFALIGGALVFVGIARRRLSKRS